MKPQSAWLRVDTQGHLQWIFIEASTLLAPVSELLFKKAASSNQHLLTASGVYRMEIRGASAAPDIQIVRVAEADEHFVVATVLREADEELRITQAHPSPASAGAHAGQAIAKDRLTGMISEAAATRAEGIDIGNTQTISIKFNN